MFPFWERSCQGVTWKFSFQTNRGGEEAEQEKAEWIVGDELKRTGWEEKDLPDQPKGAKAKVAMARRLRKETTMTLKWKVDCGSTGDGQLDGCVRQGKPQTPNSKLQLDWRWAVGRVSSVLKEGNKNSKLTLCQ